MQASDQRPTRTRAAVTFKRGSQLAIRRHTCLNTKRQNDFIFWLPVASDSVSLCQRIKESMNSRVKSLSPPGRFITITVNRTGDTSDETESIQRQLPKRRDGQSVYQFPRISAAVRTINQRYSPYARLAAESTPARQEFIETYGDDAALRIPAKRLEGLLTAIESSRALSTTMDSVSGLDAYVILSANNKLGGYARIP
jgi:hypothetical protein